MRGSVLLFVLSALVAATSAVEVWVDVAAAGHLVLERPDAEAPWPTGLRKCTDSVDAQYIAHADRYQVADWLYTERSYGDRGAIATRITINDLQAMVSEAYKLGVWKDGNDCDEVNTLLYLKVLNPIASQVGLQNRKAMSAHAHGVVVDLLCRSPKSRVFTLCTADQWTKITHSYPQK